MRKYVSQGWNAGPAGQDTKITNPALPLREKLITVSFGLKTVQWLVARLKFSSEDEI
jgi:hypothetical protein